MSQKNSILFFLILLASFFMIFKFSDLVSVEAQGEFRRTTANVTVTGNLDGINVSYWPVNFTLPGTNGRMPGDIYPKENQQPFLNVTTGPNTNVLWNISINGTNMTNEDGYIIPVENINFSYTIDEAQYQNLTLNGTLQQFASGLLPNNYVKIFFYVYIPVGSPNGTYDGDIWIYAHSYAASPGLNNYTWTGLDNTTVTVAVTFGIEWTLKPIQFGTLNPGTNEAPAWLNFGWPTNITTDANQNILVDLYINGTKLVGPVPNVIESKNVTYSNHTDDEVPPDLSESYAHTLNETRPPSSTYGDFAPWGGIENKTDLYSFWNITIPNVEGGVYEGNVTARIFPTGRDPTP